LKFISFSATLYQDVGPVSIKSARPDDNANGELARESYVLLSGGGHGASLPLLPLQ